MKRFAIISFTKNGYETALRLKNCLSKEEFLPSCYVKGACFQDNRECSAEWITEPLSEWTKKAFSQNEVLLFIGATGIAVRAVSVCLRSKLLDPAVLVMDEKGSYCISLLSGHLGGANAIAEEISRCFGSHPVITTATDLNQKWAVDLFAKEHGLQISDLKKAKEISAKILSGKQISVLLMPAYQGQYEEIYEELKKREELRLFKGLEDLEGEPDLVLSSRYYGEGEKAKAPLYLCPQLILGIGCKKGTSKEQIEAGYQTFLKKEQLLSCALVGLASIDLKAKEEGILAFSKERGLAFDTFRASDLSRLPGTFSASEFVRKTTGVDNVCERSALLASGNGRLIAPKMTQKGLTLAAAIRPIGQRKDRTESYVWKGQKKLRKGYTTGSCAAAAAKAATAMLLSGELIPQISLLTPAGIRLSLEVEEIKREAQGVTCAIRKDGGDDPDVTHGMLIYASVEKIPQGISLEGGEGIGRVTRKGLSQKPGEAAINPVPKEMILREVKAQMQECSYGEGLRIVIWAPKGEEIAKKTFNPRLGIEGGISILGTSGIVEPMSEKALLATILAEMKMIKSNGKDYCFVVPGNYGHDFLTDKLHYDDQWSVKCSNYFGETIDMAVRLKMKGLLFVGHAGKLLKLAAGIMNTHSHQADGRMEVLAAHAAMAGADRECVLEIMQCITTEEAIACIRARDLLEQTMSTLLEKISSHLQHRAGSEMELGAIIFTNETGIIGETKNARRLVRQILQG